ncbi:YdgA family protein [Cronobacter turicensis]|nr:YdgA family protein [Cronobacter turicensis]ELY3628773.1 YdgA family protein [Cronobacter turicensis]
MKKSLVAVGVIVALGVIWTGGAWYTGKQFEKHVGEMVAEANAQLKRSAPQAGLELSYQDYQRGIFSSHLQLVVKPAAGQQEALLKPGQSVVLEQVVSHGPFPLADLKKLNILPAMASVHTTLVNNATTKALFDIAKGKSFADVQTRIGYGGATSSDIQLQALNYDTPDEKVSFSGGEFQLDADKDGNEVSLKGEAGSGLVNAVNEYGQHVQLTFNGLKADGNTKMTTFNERVGEQKLDLEKLAIAIEGQEMALLEGISLNGKSDVAKDGKSIDSQMDYVMNSLKVQNQNLGSGKMTLKIGNIDGQAWHQFSQQYNERSRALMAQPGIMDNPEQYQQQATEILLSSLPLLLKGNPVITIAPLSWKNAKGESTFNLSLFLKDPSQAPVSATQDAPAEQLDRVVKTLDSKLVIPVDMATEMMTQVAKLEGYQQADAEKLAAQQVKGLAAMGQMFRITTMQDNSIVTSLQYANGQVNLNGQKMPLAEFVGMFGMPGLTAPEPQGMPEPGAVPQTAPQLVPQK